MKGPLITIIAGLGAMLGGYFGGEYYAGQREWILAFGGYFVFLAGIVGIFGGLGWGAYRLVRGKRWRP